MSGGLVQLVAYGAQDVYLTGNPQITFFKTVYRRHTNFAMESIEQTFNGSADFGKRVTCTISRNGDLISRIYLQATLPGLSQSNAAYVPYSGLVLVKSVELEIGGQRIDKHYGDWLYIWNELSLPSSKKLGYKTMVGEQTQNDAAAQNVYVPLEFWFCRNPGLALPLIALQYHEVKINLEFRPYTDMIVVSGGSAPAAVTLLYASLWVDYIFLDTDERRRFAQLSHEYLIEQLQFTGDETVTSAVNKIKMSFNHPVKELIWVVQRQDFTLGTGSVQTNQWLNFTTASIPVVVPTPGGSNAYTASYLFDTNLLAGVGANGATTLPANPVYSAKIQLNGHDRFAERFGDYFNLVQPFQHHECTPLNPGINVYSFGLKPEEHQPSGTLNMSRIDTATLLLTLKNGTQTVGGVASGAVNTYGNFFSTGTNQGTAVVKIYAVNYNVLRIMSGMGGLKTVLLDRAEPKSSSPQQHELLLWVKTLYPRKIPGQLLVLDLNQVQHTLLFGKPLRAFHTKVDTERVNWPRLHSGTVIIERIGQSACLLPKSDMLAYGRASETERVWVDDEGLNNQSRLKIQSAPLGNLGDRVGHTLTKRSFSIRTIKNDFHFCFIHHLRMNFTVIEKNVLAKIRGTNEDKIKYVLSDSNSRKYCALLWSKLNNLPIVYDYEFDEEMMKHNWYLSSVGYAYSEPLYMHLYVYQIQNIPFTTETIDHINEYKCDNRKKNLRLATQSEQNTNRATRSDKKPPCEELQNLGITDLPRYVRWDNGENKFIIDKHPYLVQEVAKGNRSKPTMSGSKSNKLTITQKYQDILARLKELDELAFNADRAQFKELKEENKREYEAICRCIQEYEGNPIEVKEEPVVPNIEPERRTAPGRKSESKLPPDCGVVDTDIPKYCYYKPKSETRGDKFVIDKHPVLVAQGKRQWSTPERTTLTTKEKFDILMEKYHELNV